MTLTARRLASGAVLSLRRAEQQDLDRIFVWRNADHVRHMMINPERIEYEQHVKWFQTLDRARNILCLYALDNIDIGVINIRNIDLVAQESDLGIYVGDSQFLKNTANIAALILAYDYIFVELGLASVRTSILNSNQTAIRLNTKLGFIFQKELDHNFNEYVLSKPDYLKNKEPLAKFFFR